ncbi:type II toxin-antitoxin system RelE/ParE family toxin [Enterovirga rhinocerotis]|uniref:Plasmid stabilization system protein ParE n=1 Tax=Enterovirga rhinocerotis TaxID=1339210 RepID=A0A4R7BUJ4_9HYPH|nr:type II toxin-antitoxin system RelE/ParE family toxin [Enterovirga rhinocerotis]TDR88255.1 plasmid stabilization system protein ParE [Enterovirga rhinocerotis]
MPRLIWSPAAIRDLSRLHRFLADKNRDAAGRAIRTIRASSRLLASHPEAGHRIAKLPPEYREWPIFFGSAGYIVRYRLSDDQITILAVRHGREAGWP